MINVYGVLFFCGIFVGLFVSLVVTSFYRPVIFKDVDNFCNTVVISLVSSKIIGKIVYNTKVLSTGGWCSLGSTLGFLIYTIYKRDPVFFVSVFSGWSFIGGFIRIGNFLNNEIFLHAFSSLFPIQIIEAVMLISLGFSSMLFGYQFNKINYHLKYVIFATLIMLSEKILTETQRNYEIYHLEYFYILSFLEGGIMVLMLKENFFKKKQDFDSVK